MTVVAERPPPVAAGPPTPGDVLALNVGDYRFGTRPIIVHVSAVLEPRWMADGEWWLIHATDLAEPPTAGYRLLLVRAAAVAAARDRGRQLIRRDVRRDETPTDIRW